VLLADVGQVSLLVPRNIAVKSAFSAGMAARRASAIQAALQRV
jgi:hypothetical protein